MYFVKWIAYQDPNPHGMQQIGLSTKWGKRCKV